MLKAKCKIMHVSALMFVTLLFSTSIVQALSDEHIECLPLELMLTESSERIYACIAFVEFKGNPHDVHRYDGVAISKANLNVLNTRGRDCPPSKPLSIYYYSEHGSIRNIKFNPENRYYIFLHRIKKRMYFPDQRIKYSAGSCSIYTSEPPGD